MPRRTIHLYRTRDIDVVSNKLANIQHSQEREYRKIQARLEMVQEYGPELGTNVFQRLRHVEGGELWELRTNGHPAYRALLAPIAGGSAYVLLDVVAKAELAKDPEKYIIQALFYLDRWLTEVYENENRSDGADDI